LNRGEEIENLRKKKKLTIYDSELRYKIAGGDILSHPLGAVPSALSGLTSLFGMGRGGSRSLLPPTTLYPLYRGIYLLTGFGRIHILVVNSIIAFTKCNFF
jgi:hypothetical protein